jgi:hypothetical protein
MYRLYLIIFLAFLVFSGDTIAAEKRYRIEILVLRHLQHDAEPLKADWLRDFSESLDFLYVAEADENGEEEKEEGVAADESAAEPAEPGGDSDGAELTDTLPGAEAELLPGEEAEQEPWAEVVYVETMGEDMQEAWRRLRLSAPFRPEQYLSWEQSADEPFPLLRIHNEEIILLDDPYADLRAELAENLEDSVTEGEESFVFTDQGSALPGEPAPETELPEPTRFHQIDGTVMLKRSRFLHLILDLELREAVYDELAMRQALIAREEAAQGEFEMPRPSSFLIHSLKQSRQVKSARMEYFDGPVLSVLAYITSVDVEKTPDLADP